MGVRGDSTRQMLLAIIQANPSLTKTELATAAGLAWGTVGYHLRRLENARYIDIFRVGRHVCIVPCEMTRDLEEAAELAPLAREILGAIAFHGTRGPTALARATGATARRVQGQLDYLVSSGLIEGDASYHKRYKLRPEGKTAAEKIRMQFPNPRTPRRDEADLDPEHD